MRRDFGHPGMATMAIGGMLVASVLVSGCSDTVRLPDCIDCRPVEMSIDQTLEVELGSDRAVSDDPEAHEWTITDPGTMVLVSEETGTRSEDPDEFIGGYSRFVVWEFEPTEPGTTEMRFTMVPTGEDGQPAMTLEIIVEVEG